MESKNLFKKIYEDHSELQIWKKLENGCYIGTLGYSERNIYILMGLLKSFEEQYGEEIDYEAAKSELMLYQQQGKLFIYFDQTGKPISMNGCVYDYDNETVEFKCDGKDTLKSVYFYGLSTLKEHRGQGACKALIQFATLFAQENGFDFVYARTDLVNSNSEWIMAKAGMEVCLSEGAIIAEWVDVTETVGDYRLHMWKPFTEGMYLEAKGNAVLANNDGERAIIPTLDLEGVSLAKIH